MKEREGLQGPRSWAISVTQNTSATSRREGQTLGAGLECKGPGSGGSCGFTASGSLEGPCNALWGRWGCPQQNAWGGGALGSGADGDGVVHWRGWGRDAKYKHPLRGVGYSIPRSRGSNLCSAVKIDQV